MTPPSSPPPESLGHLLYRYLWPFQYFRDVNFGSKLERSQNYRHNRAMRGLLPGFLCKWTLITAFFFVLGTLLEKALEPILPAACCFVTGTWTLTVAVQIMVAWLWLERFPERY